MANKILGLPVLNYFDDFGALVPDIIKEVGLKSLLRFTSVLGALMKDDKSEVDRVLVFLGLKGESPSPENGMVLRSPPLPPSKKKMR